MAPKNNQDEESGNLLKMLMSEAGDLDFTDPTRQEEDGSPNDLLEPGFEISKLFAIVEFGLRHAKDEDGLLSGTNMMDRDQAIKAINGNFLFEVTGTGQDGKPTTQFFRVDMRKEGKLIKGKGSGKPKPDVTIRVADKDLVALSTGKANPQSYFLKGRLKVKGNIMLGLKMNGILQKEVAKLSKL